VKLLTLRPGRLVRKQKHLSVRPETLQREGRELKSEGLGSGAQMHEAAKVDPKAAMEG
jgi:hypothetical protein